MTCVKVMIHKPVLKNEVVDEFEYLAEKDGNFIDGTLGLAGHSLAILSANPKSTIKIIGIDKDQEALKLAKIEIEKSGYKDRFILIHNDFSNIREILDQLKIKKINGALIDLGVSSLQLDDLTRGFSFNDPAAVLDMRMDKSQEKDAKYILNNYPAKKIEQILKEYGEERFAKNIAKNIAKKRTEKHFVTVGDLLAVLEQSIPKKVIYQSRKHFATNTFRALRMEVNDEVERLEATLGTFIDLLETGAKLAVITFHSIEDRIVKNVFKTQANPCTCPPEIPFCVCNKQPQIKLVHKKPIIPKEDEIKSNHRSRSSKMRVAIKL